MTYKKTKADKEREENDLRSNVIMRFLRYQNQFKFNVGDILIRQDLCTDGRWHTTRTSMGTPKKFMYAFENELGIGYVKLLRVDGTGLTDTLFCVVNFDPERTRFSLDPEFVDHTLVGDGEFQYSNNYANRKRFRKDAIAKNTKLLMSPSLIDRIRWFNSLKIGDVFWYARTWDDLIERKLRVTDICDQSIKMMPSHLKYKLKNLGILSNPDPLLQKYRTITITDDPTNLGYRICWDHIYGVKLMTVEPFPLKDPLCEGQD